MWPLGGALYAAITLGPSLWHWIAATRTANVTCSGSAAPLNDDCNAGMLSKQDSLTVAVWREAAPAAIADAVFAVGSLLFLRICQAYGSTRGAGEPAPYPGAWRTRAGQQRLPCGFAPFYLALALVVVAVLPAACLMGALAARGITAALGMAVLPGYLCVFLVQAALETRWLRRSFMSPALPGLFMPYRLWQLLRGLGLTSRVAGCTPTGQLGAGLLHSCLLLLLLFWAFDTGATLLWLPWMYDWELQDGKLLRKLAKADSAARAASALRPPPPPPPRRSPRLRHRAMDSGAVEFEDLGFGF